MGDILFCSGRKEDMEFIHLREDPTGGTADGYKRPDGDDSEHHDGRNRLVLSGGGAAGEVGGAGGESGSEGSSGRGCADGDAGDSEGGRVLEFPSREGLSRQLVALELQEHRADLEAFRDAYGRIHRRVQEVKDESRLMKLVNWSGTSAVMGSLELSIHSIERVVDELQQLLSRIDSGEIRDIDEE